MIHTEVCIIYVRKCQIPQWSSGHKGNTDIIRAPCSSPFVILFGQSHKLCKKSKVSTISKIKKKKTKKHHLNMLIGLKTGLFI